MIAILTLVAGIALLYNPALFAGASVIGWILVGFGGLGVAVQLLILVCVLIVGAFGNRR